MLQWYHRGVQGWLMGGGVGCFSHWTLPMGRGPASVHGPWGGLILYYDVYLYRQQCKTVIANRLVE